MTCLYIVRARGGVPGTPKDPPRNFPAGASPSSDWQRCLFSFSQRGHRPTAGFLTSTQGMPVQVRLAAPFFQKSKRGGRQLAQRGLQNPADPGQHRDAVPISPNQQRSSQVVRQRFHTPGNAGSNPASATTFQKSRARESANPPRLERGGTRGSTGARDHFPTILRSSIAEHPTLNRKVDGASPSGAAISKIFPVVDPAASVRRIPTSLRPVSPHHPGVAQCRGNELRPRPVQVRVLPPGPFSDPKLRQRSIRFLPGRAGRTSLRVHHLLKTNTAGRPVPTIPILPRS